MKSITTLLASSITFVYICVSVSYMYAHYIVTTGSTTATVWLICAIDMLGHVAFLLSGLALKRHFSFMPSSYPDTKYILLYYLFDFLQAVGGTYSAVQYMHNTDSGIGNLSKSSQLLLIGLGYVGSGVCFHRSYNMFTRVSV